MTERFDRPEHDTDLFRESACFIVIGGDHFIGQADAESVRRFRRHGVRHEADVVASGRQNIRIFDRIALRTCRNVPAVEAVQKSLRFINAVQTVDQRNGRLVNGAVL